MKKLNFIRLVISLLLLTLVFAGCEKDEIPSTGKVSISFVNHPSDLYVIISPAENTNIAIYTKSSSFNGNLEATLNAGNYYLNCSSISASHGVYETRGFQIRAGETTKISYDSNGAATVQ